MKENTYTRMIEIHREIWKLRYYYCMGRSENYSHRKECRWIHNCEWFDYPYDYSMYERYIAKSESRIGKYCVVMEKEGKPSGADIECLDLPPRPLRKIMNLFDKCMLEKSRHEI